MASKGNNNRFFGRHFLLAAALLLLAVTQGGCVVGIEIGAKLAEVVLEDAFEGGGRGYRGQPPEDFELRNVSEPPIKADAGRMYVYLSPSPESDNDDRRFYMEGLIFYEKDDERTALVLDGRVLRADSPCIRCIPGVVSVDLAPGPHTLQAVHSSRIAIQKLTIVIERGESIFIRISLDDSQAHKLVFESVKAAVGREEANEKIYESVDFEKLGPVRLIGIQSGAPGTTDSLFSPGTASAPPSVRRPPLRIALFPAIEWYGCDNFRDESVAARAIEQSLSSNSQLNLVFSAFRSQQGQNKLPKDLIVEINFYQWSIAGPGLNHGPDFNYIVETGNKLDVDAVLLISYDHICGDTKGDFFIWLIELKIMQDYYVRFYSRKYSVSGHDELAAAMNGFLNVHLPLLNRRSGSM